MQKQKTALAKLLAQENIIVRVAKVQTGTFNPASRVLTLPLYMVESDYPEDTTNMMIAHEAGHALYSPADYGEQMEGKGLNFDLVNILEDIRIERLLRLKYIGLCKIFKSGYTHILGEGFFGDKAEISKKISKNEMSFGNKLNLDSKAGFILPTFTYSDEEQILRDKAFATVTFEDVLEVAVEITKLKKDEEIELKEIKNQTNGDTETEDFEEETEEDEDGEDDGSIETDEEGEDEDGEDDGSIETDEEEGKSVETSDTVEDEDEDDSTETSDTIKVEDQDSGEQTEETTYNEFEDDYDSTTEYEEKINKDMFNDNIHIISYPLEDLYHITDIPNIIKQLKTNHDSDGVDIIDLSYKLANVMIDMPKAKKIAKHMAENFNRKKSAFQYSNSTVDKSGILDVNRLHQYSTSDDIFLSKTTLANSNNHGNVIMIDFSYSMNNIAINVLTQALITTLFCKQAQIPIEVYTYTSDRTEHITKATICKLFDHKTAVKDILTVLGLLAVKNGGILKTKTLQQHNEACHLHYDARALMRDLDKTFIIDGQSWSNYIHMASTPSVEALSGLHNIIIKFKKQYNVQICNTLFFTDGKPQQPNVYKDNINENPNHPEYEYRVPENSDVRLRLKLGNKEHILDISKANVHNFNHASMITAHTFFMNEIRKHSKIIYMFTGQLTNSLPSACYDIAHTLPHGTLDNRFLFSDKIEPWRKKYVNDKCLNVTSLFKIKLYDEIIAISAKLFKDGYDDTYNQATDNYEPLTDAEIGRAMKSKGTARRYEKTLATLISDAIARGF